MFLEKLFSSFSSKSKKIHLINTLIDVLNVDSLQKNLYKESLSLLTEEELSTFYKKLISIVNKHEQKNLNIEPIFGMHNSKNTYKSDKNQQSSFDIVFNNIS